MMEEHFAPVAGTALILTSILGWLLGSLWIGVVFVVGLATWGMAKFDADHVALPFFVGATVTGVLFLLTSATVSNGNWGLFFSLVAGVIALMIAMKK